MFGYTPMNRFAMMARLPGVIGEEAKMSPDHPLNHGPGGPMNDAGPSTIRLTDPSRYGQAPSIYGGGSMAFSGGQAGQPQMGQAPVDPSAMQGQPVTPGMFGGGSSKGHKGLFPGKDWKTIVPMLANALAAYSASSGNPAGQAILENNLSLQRQMAEDKRNFEYKRRLAMQPSMEHVGNTLGMFDPSAMSYNPIYTAPDAPQPFEAYASSLGLTPGTPEYYDAIKEYRAGTWNNEGVAGRLTVQQPRLDQSNTNNLRTTGTSRDNNIRSNATSRANNHYSVDHRGTGGHGPLGSKPPTPTTVIGGIMDKQARGEPLTASEQSTLKDYRTHYKPQRGAPQIGPNEAVAHGPNGQTLIVRNGQWIDAATGKPVK